MIIKSSFLAFATLLAACGGDENCVGDLCTCPTDTACSHDCSAGAAECHITGAPQQPVDVTCHDNGTCQVECADSTSCKVDCGGSPDCRVTCPATGCTVHSCSGPGCIVSCGALGEATYAGTTATCP